MLTTTRPPNLEQYPPPLAPGESPAATPSRGPATAPPPSAVAGPVSVPQFRLLGLEDSFTRSRHAGPSEVSLNTSARRATRDNPDTNTRCHRQQGIDTSDAHYFRLHRFPEVLEKRSARLERDRLIHERSKLILEIEEMRGRGWVYQGMQGGKGEQLRRRRLDEGEERLKRSVPLSTVVHAATTT